MSIYSEINIDIQSLRLMGVRFSLLALIRYTVLLCRQKNQKLSAVIASGHVIPRILHKTKRSQVSRFYDSNSWYVLHANPSPIQCRRF